MKRRRFLLVAGMLLFLALQLALTFQEDIQRTRTRSTRQTVAAPEMQRAGRNPRGPRSGIDGTEIDISGIDLREYTDWFQALEKDYARQLTLADDRDLQRMNARLNSYFYPRKQTQASARREWITAVLGLVDYMAEWDSSFLAEFADEKVSLLSRPPRAEFLAATADQPFIFIYRVVGSNKMYDLVTKHADLGDRATLRLTLKRQTPTVVKLYLSSIETGSNSYRLELVDPSGQLLLQSTFALEGVKPAQLNLNIVEEETGKSTEALMAVYPANGRDLPNQLVPFYVGERTTYTRRGILKSTPEKDNRVFITRGNLEMQVHPGPCRVLVSKGPEYRVVEETFDTLPGQTTEKTLNLRRFVNLPSTGWYSADDHCHIPRSPSRDVDVMDLLRAVDLHFTNIVQMGDEDRLYFLQSSWGVPSHYWRNDSVMAAGQEDPRTTWRGHTLMLNTQGAIHDRNTYYLYEQAFKEARKQGGLTGYAHEARRFGGELGATLSIPLGLVDFVELESSDAVGREVLYHFWNLGFRITATNGADFPYGSLPGGRRFFMHVDGELTFEKAVAAIKAGRTFVSNGGAFLQMRINGQLPGSVLRVEPGETLKIEIRAAVNPDFDRIGVLEIVRFGRVIDSFAPTDSENPFMNVTASFRADQNCWIAGRLFGATSHQISERTVRHRANAHTSAFYIEVNGNYTYDPTGLESELTRAFDHLDKISKLAEMDTPLMNRQRERFLGYVEQARHVYRQIGNITNSDSQRR